MSLEPDYQRYTALIPEWRVREVLAKLLRLSQHAQKLGMPAFEIEAAEAQLRSYGEFDSLTKARMVPVTVVGGAPKLSGWRFLAKIEHEETGNEVKGIGAQKAVDKDPELFKELTECPPDCQHCNVKRNRNTTYYFEKVQGSDLERIQVGSSCVEDFAGHKSPHQILSLASGFIEIINEIQDEEGMSSGGSMGSMVFETQDVLAIAAALVRVDGRWISREAADMHGNPSTGDMVTALATDGKSRRKLITDADKHTGEEVANWLESDEFEVGSNLYLHNLQKMAHRGYVQYKALGFFGSAVATWNREMAQRVKIEEQQKTSMKLGEEGERLSMTVQIEKIIPIETMMGLSRLHIMKDAETGSKVTWFNSGQSKFMVGDTYSIKGRVKGHREWKGIWETQLSRVTSPDLALHNKIHEQMNESDLIKKAKKLDRIDARDGDGENLIHVVSHVHRFREVGKDLILALVEQGANPGIKSDRDDYTAVDYWIDSRDEDLIQLAMERFPQHIVGWTDIELKEYDLWDKPWVPGFRVVRNEASAAIEAQKPKESTPVPAAQIRPCQSTESGTGSLLADEDDPEDDEDDSLQLA